MLSSQSSQLPSRSLNSSSLCTFFLSRCRRGASAPQLSIRLCSGGSPDSYFFPISHAPHATHRPSNVPIPFRITSFAAPNHITPIESYSYKKEEGEGHPFPSKQFPDFPQRVNMQRTATPTTPFLSCAYFKALWIPGVEAPASDRALSCRPRACRCFVTSLLRPFLHGTNAPLARLHRCRGELHA